MKSRRWFRFVAVGCAVLMGFSSTATGMAEAYKTLSSLELFKSERHRLPHYSAQPHVFTLPPGNHRDASRSSWWTAEKVQDAMLAELETGQGDPSVFALNALGLASTWNSNQQGAGIPGEGTGPGGGSAGSQILGTPGGSGLTGVVNTNTGNKLSVLPITSVSGIGDLTMGVTLYHNSIGSFTGSMGPSWRHSYDVTITGHSSSYFLTMPDGLIVPYTLTSGVYVPPAGWFHKLVKNGGGTWTLTFKNQSKYEFDVDGYLVQIIDRYNNTLDIQRHTSGAGMIHKVDYVELPDGREYDFGYTSNVLTSITEDFGGAGGYSDRTWAFGYTSTKLTSVTYPYNATIAGFGVRSFTYNGNKIASEVDLEGAVWSFTYDGSDRLLTFSNYTYPTPDTFTYAYSSGTTTMELPMGETSSHTYTSDLLVLTQDAASFGVGYSYNSQRQVTVKTDKDSNNWGYDYDTDGNLIHVLDPVASNTWDYTYNSNNDLTSATTPLGNEKVIVYSGLLLDRIEQEVGVSDWRITEISQSGDGTISAVTDERGVATTFSYDSYGNADLVTAAGVSTTYEYDPAGRLTGKGQDPYNLAIISYDTWSRPIAMEHPDLTGTPDSDHIEIEYTDENYPERVINELGKTISANYDDNHRIASYIVAGASAKTYVRNDNGWVTEVEAPTGTTKYTLDYNVRGEVIGQLLSGHTIDEEWSYTGSGDVATYSSPSGTFGSTSYYNTDFTYDPRGALLSIDYPSGTSDVSFAYDDDGRQVTMYDGSGTTDYVYNRADDLISYQPPSGIDVDYTFNIAGQVDSITENGTNIHSYTYENTTDRLWKITNPQSEVTEISYDAEGRVDEKLFHSGQKEVMAYDKRNRVLSVDLKDGSTFLRTQDYSYNAGSQITQSIVTDGTSTLEDVAYLYNDGGALISEDHTGGPKIEYDYDLSGNRTEKKTTVGLSVTTLNYVYSTDNEDRLLSINDGVNTLRTFTYDNARRRISEVNGGGTTSYSYDHASRLIGITYPNATTDSFGYNGLDTRLSKTENSTTTNYNRAGSSVTDPVLSDTNASYTPGISERRSSTTTYLHSGLKNVGAQSNTSKVVTASKEFDAFGEELGATGTWKGQSGYGGGFGYQSAERSGLMLLGHRYYDPSTGSFLTSDPAKSDDNWFAYCWNNPLSFADPTGHVAFLVPLLLVAFVLTADVAMAPTSPEDICKENLIAVRADLGSWKLDAIALIGGIASYRKSGLDSERPTISWRYRKELGRDGAISRFGTEKENGKTVSVIHQVRKNGEIVHQHQEHVPVQRPDGVKGPKRGFPDEWVEFPRIGKVE